ncbi:MAG: ketosteroid isomerase-like protein [Desulforhopalus sp.]|jgi:ketosteroid isomerase-like protein
MLRYLFFANILISTLLLTPTFASDDKAMSFKEYLEQANSYIKSYRHFEASDALKEATILGGAKHPSLHMRLGILYYGLGLIPEAIAEGERAVHLAPASKWYKYDLAKFYYVDKQFNKAEQQFTILLKIDPGFTLAYYYLAELYFQQKQYDMAWLSMQRAYKLGHKGQHLEAKIGPLSTKPQENFDLPANSPKLFRFIKLSDAQQAQELTNEIWNGKLFENLELELKKDQNNSADFGIMTLDELKSDVANSLQDKKPYSRPLVIQTGSDYRIMQRILPFDSAKWQRELAKTAPAVPSATISKQEEPTIAVPPITTNPPVPPVLKDQISSKLAAFYALEAWHDAWENQDVKAYLSAYSQNFTPNNGLSQAAWKEKRTKSIFRPSSIQIEIEDPVVEMLTDGQLLITFKQNYTSNTYHDIVVKTLTMDKEVNGWKITKEREVKVIRD